MTTTITSSPDLAIRWAALLEERPKTRIRDAAGILEVSEAELLATTIDGKSSIRLKPAFREIVARLPALGRVMALTRNEIVVHERRGAYEEVDTNGHVGLVTGADIDLRIFFSAWAHGFALEEPGEKAVKRSLQFFDAHGDAVHKVFLKETSDVEAFTALVETFRAEEQHRSQEVLPPAPVAVEKPDEKIDVVGFRTAWDNLRDTHDFFPLLKEFGLGRLQALRLAGKDRARELSRLATRRLLETAAVQQLPIMVFVGNPGCIQIHTGTVSNIETMGPWLNVLDPEFNLHLREDLVHSAWIVVKPTRDGHVHSLELFDARGENVALFFGKRKPGLPEEPAWRALLREVEMG